MHCEIGDNRTQQRGICSTDTSEFIFVYSTKVLLVLVIGLGLI